MLPIPTPKNRYCQHGIPKIKTRELQNYRIKQNSQGAANFATGMALSLV
jgi:hypothetical protein